MTQNKSFIHNIIYFLCFLVITNIAVIDARKIGEPRHKKKSPVAKTTTAQSQSVKNEKIECPEEQKKSTDVSSKPTEKEHTRKSKKQSKRAARKTLSKMNFEELKKAREQVLAANNKESAIKYSEKMIPLCKDIRELETIMIELGDLYYDVDKLARAYAVYREFVNLYPGSSKVEYALYRATVCKFKGINDAERDQEPTKETITLAQEFLERSELFVTYRDQVEDMLKQCCELLFENEKTVFDFYLKHDKIISADKRLDTIKKDYALMMPEFEPQIMILDIKLAQAQGQQELVVQRQEELLAKFPGYNVVVAQEQTDKKHFTQRF